MPVDSDVLTKNMNTFQFQRRDDPGLKRPELKAQEQQNIDASAKNEAEKETTDTEQTNAKD